MSADNYYTIKFDPVGLKWYVLHGFMSDLEQGIPALLRNVKFRGFDDYADALARAGDGYSEYGVIQEPSPLDEILAVDQWREHLERTIRLSQEHLAWINGEGTE